MNFLNRIRAIAAYRGAPVVTAALNITARNTAVTHDLPCIINSQNFRPFIMTHQLVRIKFVAHITTGIMAFGHIDSIHKSIGMSTISHPDVGIEFHPNVVGGIICIAPFPEENSIGMIIDGNSATYGHKDPLEAVKLLISIIESEGTGFKIDSKSKSGDTPSSVHYELRIKNIDQGEII